jgi:indolepyruvate ferredoxin oxidoreductase
MTVAVSLDDKYRLARGRVYMTGVQALVRLPMLQHERDRAAGLDTAGYVSGYRGSPLAALDSALFSARPHLQSHGIDFHPAVNEDLAATAIWGTQQLHLLPGAKRDGIFAMWYGKGPGVDRCGDVFRHANHAGTSRHGGVLLVAGDDHSARSSAVAHQSEHIFAACAIPVLAPADLQDVLDLGLHGWAMSRYCGCWVAMKTTADVVESSATVEIDPQRVKVTLPADFALPADGVHIRWPDPQLAQERRMQEFKVYAAVAYARANGLNRLVWDAPRPRLGIIACGKAWLDVRQALSDLGIDERVARDVGLRLYKVGMAWPLEADGVRHFAEGLEEILVVEEKRQIIEYQLKEQLYNWREDVRPRVLGKFDESGEWPAPHGGWLLPPVAELTPALVARAIAARLARLQAPESMRRHLAFLDTAERPPAAAAPRTPYFCSGCPHNRSTRVPEGSCALGGVGCHLMATWMGRDTLTISQMGGEGATWLGMAAHSGTAHVFANMGDGTYYHSGLLAVRAAVAAGVNITYKILYNGAVAMTGGQPVDGPLTVPQITRQLEAEGVRRIVVVADDPAKYGRDAGFAPGVAVRPRGEMAAVQRELRAMAGVTALVFDQTCATEQRRRRNRRGAGGPLRRVFIHEAVCEGCGDCSVQSNCLAVVPVATEFGRKAAIDQHACNQDESCLDGCCPALVTVIGGSLHLPRRQAPWPEALPEPALPSLQQPYAMLVAGVGGTGVVTLAALVGMAAHLDGHGVTVLDQTGLAQKGGAVLSHLRLARHQGELHAPRICTGGADALIGCDARVAAGAEALSKLRAGRTRAVVSAAPAIGGEFIRGETPAADAPTLANMLRAVLGAEALELVDAPRLARLLIGPPLAANLLLLGFAWQRGLVPVTRESMRQAIALNGVAVDDNLLAFEWGRRAAVDIDGTEHIARQAERVPPAHHLSASLEETIERRRDALIAYQDERYAQRYLDLVARARQAEQAVAPGSTQLARAVAVGAFRLMACKDEYEVARLYAGAPFRDLLRQIFDGDYRLRLHLAIPWLARTDAASGRPSKREYGAWVLPALRWLARLKSLRGTRFDPFRNGAERRLDRELLAEYETTLAALLRGLRADNLALAAQVAALPEEIRGFGPVRARAAQAASARRKELMAAFQGRALPVAEAA